MKDTVGWIDYIPDGWNIMKFRQLITRISTGLNPRDNFKLTKDDNLYYVTIRNFKDGKLYLDDKCDRISYESWKIIQERSDLHKGDILFASISKDGQAYLLKEEPASWNVNESVFCIRVNKEYMDARYFTYEITSTRYYDDLRMDATGTTCKSIKQNNLKQSRLLVPPISEQQAIADYLDEKCSKIDEIIVESKASIDEYKKLKQSVIFEAVTKGLDKNMKMKATGENWLPLIPNHWKMEKGKNLLFETNFRSADGQEELLTVSQYTGVTPRSKKNVTMFQSESLVDYKICEVGDIAANTMWMWAGAVGVSQYHGVISPSYNTYRQKHNDYDYVYLDYMLRIAPLVDEYASLSTGIRASRLRLYPKQFLGIIFPVPPFCEQRDIVEFLDKKTSEIDSLISEKQSLIQDLEAYKKSLIYEVVTGKRRVV